MIAYMEKQRHIGPARNLKPNKTKINAKHPKVRVRTWLTMC